MKVAVLLFSFGSPSKKSDVARFLFSMFADPAILRIATPWRQILATILTITRLPKARRRYALLTQNFSVPSPLLKHTRALAEALEEELNDLNAKCFIAMRYGEPSIAETWKTIRRFHPDIVIQLSLFPQFSTATTGSCLRESARYAIDVPVKTIESFQDLSGLIDSITEAFHPIYTEAEKHGLPRVLFSAHGLPEKFIQAGDPYQKQCEQTVQALVLKIAKPDMDWTLCYQSRVGPMKWLEPSLESETVRAAQTQRPIVVVPVSFVTPNIETVIDLEIETRQLALSAGAPFFASVPIDGKSFLFIKGIASAVRATLHFPHSTSSAG